MTFVVFGALRVNLPQQSTEETIGMAFFCLFIYLSVRTSKMGVVLCLGLAEMYVQPFNRHFIRKKQKVFIEKVTNKQIDFKN